MRILRSTIARLPSPCNQKSPLLQCRGDFFSCHEAAGAIADAGRPQEFQLLRDLAADLAIGKFGAVDIDVHFSCLQIGNLGISQGG